MVILVVSNLVMRTEWDNIYEMLNIVPGTSKTFNGLGRVAWLEGRLIHQKVAGSIPSGGACRRQPTDVSLSHQYFSLFFSLKSINISLGED